MTTMVKPRFNFDKAAHCYTVDGQPYIGTTTALSVMDKSGLTWWASGMACAEFGWLNPKKNPIQACQEAARAGLEKVRGMSLGDYIVHLGNAYKAFNTRKNEAKDVGIDMHSLLENFIRKHMAGDTNAVASSPAIIEPFICWTQKNVKRFLFTELCCFSTVLHVAGTADFWIFSTTDIVSLWTAITGAQRSKRIISDFISTLRSV